MRRWALSAALAAALGVGDGRAAAEDAPAPKKSAVGAPLAPLIIQRRQKSLGDAFRLILQRQKTLGVASGVAIIVDSTDAVKQARGKIAEALTGLDALPGRPTKWQVAPLGGALSTPVASPAALGPALDAALSAGAPTGTDTIAMIRDTLKARRPAGAGGLVVYLACTHFEDDADLEALIGDLRGLRRSLSVIGPEAAFERCWSDVMLWHSPGGPDGYPIPGVGASPFGAQDPTRPWHGGDTAYPLIPYRFGLAWDTTFRSGKLEVALPSGFGPYGLMRAAGVADGVYVLWEWATGDAAPVKYDYGRCNLFPPDLRSRDEILKDLPHRPLARALLDAWALLVDSGGRLVEHTPPLRRGAPSTMTHLLGASDEYVVFEKPKDRDDYVESAQSWIGLAERARKTVDDEVRRLGESKEDVDRRLRADAHLLLFALDTLRFHIAESVALAKSLGHGAWSKGSKASPWLKPLLWLHGAEDDQPAVTDPVHLMDPDGAARLLAARADFLERYRGTPFGAIVARNFVSTFQSNVLDMTPVGPVDLPRSGKGSSTGPTPPPAPPGGSSTGAGPTTGGK